MYPKLQAVLTLENKGFKKVLFFLKQFPQRTIFFLTVKNISIFLWTFSLMLKVLHRTIKANKEPLLDYMEVGKHQCTNESSICVTTVYCSQFMKAACTRYVVLQICIPQSCVCSLVVGVKSKNGMWWSKWKV